MKRYLQLLINRLSSSQKNSASALSVRETKKISSVTPVSICKGRFFYILVGLALAGCFHDEPIENRPPVIQSAPIEVAQSGETYSYQVVATDRDNDPLIYSLEEKPTGMVIDSLTGMITWTPSAAGSFSVIVSVGDNEGNTVTQRYSITVQGAPEGPVLPLSAYDAFDYLYEVMDQFHRAFDVYTDFGKAGNHYIPSGWMGNQSGLTLDENWNDACYAGDSCIRAAYTPGGANWAGIYWQTPENNWGTVQGAGFDLTGATKLTFWARGEEGGEKIAFLAGGISGAYPDSLSKTYTDDCVISGADCFINLTDKWQQYTISLEGKNLSHIIGGFAFVTNTPSNPSGAVFYLDEIRYDKPRLNDPRFLVSYEAFSTTDPDNPDVYLRTPAFVYDNALVVLAFLSRGNETDIQRAKLIVDAFVYAQSNDRAYTDGRLRNAYMAGDLVDHMTRKARLPTWWDAEEERSQEDEFQVSTHIGNLAWAAMAMLGYYEQVGDESGRLYLESAIKLAEWIENNTRDDRGAGGYTGGVKGWSGSPEKILWKSTEQNTDVYVIFSWLERLTGDPVWGQRAEYAKGFVESMWDDTEKHFWTGTNDDGETNKVPVPVDVQAWAVLAFGNSNKYEPALDWVLNNLHTEADGFVGFDFNEDKDGIWFEGTAQMVVDFKRAGRNEKADLYLGQLRNAQLSANNSNGKGIVAASHDGVSTGFEGWFLYSRLHIGATAWYLFAEMGYAPWDLPPKVVITSYPGNLSNSSIAAFGFSSTKSNTRYQCQVDEGDYVDCVSPTEFSGLTSGDHVFCVTGIDLSLERTSTPACYRWIIDLVFPINATKSEFVNSGSSSTDNTNVILMLSASDERGIVAYYVVDDSSSTTPISPSKDDEGWVNVQKSNEYSSGVSYQFRNNYENDDNVYVYVWFRDEAGNVSESAVDSIRLSDEAAPVNMTPDDFASRSAPSIASNTIALTISATDNGEVSGYYIADNKTGVLPDTPLANGPGWTDIFPTANYDNSVVYTLSSVYSPGVRVFVYVWFKDGTGNVSEVVSDSFTVQTFSEGFDDGWGTWSADNGVWQVGNTTAISGGCLGGTGCVATSLDGNYAGNTDTRLQGPRLQLPVVSGMEEVHLRFQQWFSYSRSDSGRVQIQVWDVSTASWGSWINVGTPVADTSGWSLKDVDFTAYAGEIVRLGFYHTADCYYSSCSDTSTGWYIDDVEVVVKVPEFSGDFEAGWGDWGAGRGLWGVGAPTAGPMDCYSGERCAGTELEGNYGGNTDSRLVSATTQLPAISGMEEVHLRFQQWFSYSRSDSGRVQIQVWDVSTASWGSWIDVGTPVADTSGWSLKDVDLTAYAGEIVRLGFYHTADCYYSSCSDTSTGWYIDDIVLQIF